MHTLNLLLLQNTVKKLTFNKSKQQKKPLSLAAFLKTYHFSVYQSILLLWRGDENEVYV